MIVCPGCGTGADVEQDIKGSVFEWSCKACGKGFEVRIVFFERAKPVDQAAFRDKVQRLLAEQGLNKTELASLVGVSPAYISVLLSGRREVTAGAASRVLHALRAAESQAFL